MDELIQSIRNEQLRFYEQAIWCNAHSIGLGGEQLSRLSLSIRNYQADLGQVVAQVDFISSSVEWGEWVKGGIWERGIFLIRTAGGNINRLVNHVWG